MVSDPVADFIIRLKNAGMAGKREVLAPYAKVNHAIAEKLRECGYVVSVAKKGKKDKPLLEVELAFAADGAPKIAQVERLSKPGRRVYGKADEFYPVLGGTGTLFVSTPKGVKTGEEARKERVGGELLFKLW